MGVRFDSSCVDGLVPREGSGIFEDSYALPVQYVAAIGDWSYYEERSWKHKLDSPDDVTLYKGTHLVFFLS